MTDTDHPTAEDYRNKAERAEQALAEQQAEIVALQFTGAAEVTQVDQEAVKRHQQRYLTERESETNLLSEAFAAHRAAGFAAGAAEMQTRVVAYLRNSPPDHSDEGGCPFDKAADAIDAEFASKKPQQDA